MSPPLIYFYAVLLHVKQVIFIRIDYYPQLLQTDLCRLLGKVEHVRKSEYKLVLRKE